MPAKWPRSSTLVDERDCPDFWRPTTLGNASSADTSPGVLGDRTRSNVGDNQSVEAQDGVGRVQASLPLQSPTRPAVAQVLSELLPGVDTTVVDWGHWDTDRDGARRGW